MMKKTRLIVLVMVCFMALPSIAQRGKQELNKEKARAKMEELFSKLELDDTQKESVKAILKEERGMMREARIPKEKMEAMKPAERKATRAKLVSERNEIKQRTKAKLSEVLSPEQMEKYFAIQEERKLEMEENKKERLENKSEKHNPSGS